MPTRYDSDSDSYDDRDPRGRDRDQGGEDREISLGTGTVLAIFLALALVCSLFFGLGYSMGRKSTPPIPSASTASPATENLGRSAPGIGSGTAPSRTGSRADLQVAQPSQEGADVSTSSIDSTDQPAVPRTSGRPTIPRPSPAVASAVPDIVVPVIPTTGPQIFVQIAAVSRQEDSNLLLAALRKRGYTALVRQQPQDKLLHIQVGPFPSKKDAEVMRQRLIVDGYNPIIK